jgi:glycosyltransferase involved in cell wall biosynthesis
MTPFIRQSWLQPRHLPDARGRRRILILAGGGLGRQAGGVGTLLRNLLEEWERSPPGPPVLVIDTRGGGGRLAGSIRFAAATVQLLANLAAGRVGLVHAHMTTRGSAVRKAVLAGLAMGFGVRVVIHLHGADFLPFFRRLHPVLQSCLRILLQRAWRVIVLGEAWRCFLIEEVGVAAACIALIPNGVPRPCLPRLRNTDQPPQLLFLGRLCPRKGVRELIEALAAPEVAGRAWRASLAGDGDAAPYVRLACRLGIGDRVDFPGWADRPAAQALLARADILLLPSHHEAMPMAVLEALAAQVAIIATPVGCLPEYLTDDVNCRFVPAGDVAALAILIRLLLDDPAARDRLAGAGGLLFREQFDVALTAARIRHLYLAATTPDPPVHNVSALRPAGAAGRWRAR